MALITTHATLVAAVAEWLNRGDISSSGVGIDLMIQSAEARLRRDPRVKTLDVATFSVDADDEAAPTGFRTLVSLEHNSSPYGTIEIVGPSMIAELKGRYGASGRPRYAAVLDKAGSYVFRFAPVPDGTYTLRMVFWRTLTALSAGSNWLVASHPDIYLYATLCESAGYMKDDERLPIWEQALEQRIEALHLETWEHGFSGAMRQQVEPIG